MDFNTGIKKLGVAVLITVLYIVLACAISALFTVGQQGDKFCFFAGVALIAVGIAGIVLIVKRMNKTPEDKKK